MIILFLLAIVFTEAATELLVKSDIFSGVRDKCQSVPVLNRLLMCGYCCSYWIALIPSTYIVAEHDLKCYLIPPITIVIARLSNLAHFLIDRADRYYDTPPRGGTQ